MRLRGYIDFVIYPKGGLDPSKLLQFAVFSVNSLKKVGLNKKRLKCVGKIPMFAEVGDYLEFEGDFDTSGDFKFTTAQRVDDDQPGAEAMMAFCFGKKTSEKIASAFENDFLKAWNAFKDHRDQFIMHAIAVKGVGKGTLDKGIMKYENHMAVDLLANKFSKYGLHLPKALTVYEAWGSSCLKRIEANPYDLIDIPISFDIADRIAIGCYGISKLDSRRIYAGVQAVMKTVMQMKGHTFLWLNHPQHQDESLVPAASRKLKVDTSSILEEIINLSRDSRLCIERKGFHKIVYLPAMLKAEKGIASIVKQSISENRIPEDYMNSFIAKYEKVQGFELADMQKLAVKTSVKNKLSIISGPPGSGKTTIIDCICRLIESVDSDASIRLCAPTGKAAKRMTESTGRQAMTVHRILEFSPELKGFGRNETNPIDADVLIVDEFSMMSVSLTYSFLKAVSPHSMVIFVGDKEQLPSIDPGKVLEDLLNISFMPRTILDRTYRQKRTSTILNRALDVSHHIMPDLSPAEDFRFWEEQDVEELQSRVVSLYYEECGKYGLENVLLLSPMNKNELGVDRLNEIIQDELNPCIDGEPELKHGKRFFRKHDRVVQLKNEENYDVYNGMVGEVIDIELGDATLGTFDKMLVDFDGHVVEYERGRFEHLKHAYAMTIHKSQGSEAKSVIIVCHSSQAVMMRRKLIYTGMTRAKSKLQMCGEARMIDYSLSRKEEPRNSKLKEYMYS